MTSNTFFKAYSRKKEEKKDAEEKSFQEAHW